MSASKNCQCPVCKEKAEVKIDGCLWYFRCIYCNSLIGVTAVHISRSLKENHSLLSFRGTWSTAKEAIKAIKEYMR